MSRIRAFFALIGNAIGIRELFLVIGLALVGYGLSLLSIAAAFVVPGSVMVAVAVFGVRGQVQPVREIRPDSKDARLRAVS